MVVFSDELLNGYESRLKLETLNDLIPENKSKEELGTMLDNGGIEERPAGSNPSSSYATLNPSKPAKAAKAARGINVYNELMGIQSREYMKAPEGTKIAQPSGYSSYMDGIDEDTYMSNVNELYLQDLKYNKKIRKQASYGLGHLSSGDMALAQSFERWLASVGKENTYMSPDDATALARSLGADLKFAEPKTVIEVQQAAAVDVKRREYEQALAMAYSTGDLGFWNNAQVNAAMVAGVVGPVELATLVASAFIPELGVAAIAKTAGTVSELLKAKKVADAVKIANTVRMTNTIAKSATAAEAEGQALASVFMRNAATKLDTARIKSAAELEKLSKATYETVGAGGSMAADSAAFLAVDVPWALTKKNNSDQLEIDVYSEQDMAVETLCAAAAGVALPKGIRVIRNKLFKNAPAAVVEKSRIDREINIERDVALGNMTEEKAAVERAKIASERAEEKALQEATRKPNPHLIKAGEILSQENTTSEETLMQKQYMLTRMMQGTLPRISEFPAYTKMFSSVNAQVVRKLLNEKIEDVFGSHIIRRVSAQGLASGQVVEDARLLGMNAVHGFSQEEVNRNLHNLYRGYLLKDQEALVEYREYTQRLSGYAKQLRDIEQRYREKRNANIYKKAGISSDELVNLREEFRDAYINGRLNEQEAAQLEWAIEENERLRALGLEEIGYTDSQKAFLNEFEDFYEKFVKEKTREDGGVYYDIKNRKAFNQYLADLDEAVADNVEMGNLDNYIKDLRQEQVETYLRNMYDLDVSPDTDLERLFGTPRTTYESVNNINENVARSNKILAVNNAKFEEFTREEKIVEAKRLTDKFHNPSKNKTSYVMDRENTLEWIDNVRQNSFNEVNNSIMQEIRDSKYLQKSLSDYLQSGGTLTLGVKRGLRDAIVRGLSKSEIFERISGKSELANNLLNHMLEQLADHDMAKALLTPELLKEVEEVSEWTSAGRKPGIAGETMAKQSILFDPVNKAITLEVNNLEIRMKRDLALLYEGVDFTTTNPHQASEYLTGKSTQAIYSFEGSKRSVEYLTRSGEAYIQDISNQLAKMESQNEAGKNLLQIMNDPSNRDKIIEARIRAKFGEEISDNSDIGRIVKVIMDNEATFESSMNTLGSDYHVGGSWIDPHKLRHVDGFISDDEAGDLVGNMFESSKRLVVDNDTILESCRAGTKTTDSGATINLYKSGDRFITEEEAIAAIEDARKLMDRTIAQIDGLIDPVYKKQTLFAIRDLDLDRMFNKDLTAKLSYNEMRDLLLDKTHEVVSFADGDILNIKYMAEDFRSLVTKLIGTGKGVGDVPGNPDVTKWIIASKNRQDSIAAVASGKVSAYVNKYHSAMFFKDAESEIKATQAMGRDTIRQAIKREAEINCKAFYSLETFGSDAEGLVNQIIDVYNAARLEDTKVSKSHYKMARKINKKNYIQSWDISKGKRESILQNVAMNNGLQDEAPSSWARVLKATQTILASSLLFKAGLKSFSDYATIQEGLVINGFMNGRLEAAKSIANASLLFRRHPELKNLTVACGIVEQERMLKTVLNDPGADVMSLSKAVTPLDRYENFAKKLADLFINKMAHVGDITNDNKQVAALTIQRAIASKKNVPFHQLEQRFQDALIRESIDAQDWELFRKMAMRDAFHGIEGAEGKKFMDVFDPRHILKMSDDEIAQEMAKRGVLNITSEEIEKYRIKLHSKAWNIIDSSADEMVSLPSGRIMNIMRGGRSRNTGWGAVIEMMTQFQSFGAALAYNTYGRTVANFIARETGVSFLDVFNPMVKLNRVKRGDIYGSLFASFLSVGASMLAVDSAVNALSGNIQKPIDEEGNIHLEDLSSAALGALGIGGTILDAIGEGIMGSGQKGGGFSIQIAPSAANAIRMGYRVTKPMRLKEADNKPAAVAAGLAQEAARFTGLRSFPIVALVWQDLVGSWLDMQAAGGIDSYDRYIQGREERGMVIMPWERDPQPIWDRL